MRRADNRGAWARPLAVLTACDARGARFTVAHGVRKDDPRLALIEASEEKIGNVVDQLLLLCYHYDPKAGRYTATVRNLVRGAGAITFVLLAGFVTILLWREHAGAGRPPQ